MIDVVVVVSLFVKLCEHVQSALRVVLGGATRVLHVRYEDFIASRVHAISVLVSTEVAPSVRDVSCRLYPLLLGIMLMMCLVVSFFACLSRIGAELHCCKSVRSVSA